MMQLSKYFKLIPLCFLTIGLLTGCDDVQIFQSNTDPNELVAYKDTELVNDKYYGAN